MPRNTWFNIQAKSADTAEIDIFDEIGFWGVTAKDFVNQLRGFSGLKHITLNIDCPGGSCDDGFTIFDAIKSTSANVTANIIGTAASMASVIMLAAKKITIAENGRVMIHRVTAGGMGNPDDLDAVARIARQFEDRIVKLYVERTSAKETQVREWMQAEMGTWFFGQDAVDAGFADEVKTGAKAKAFKPEWAPLFTMLPSARLFDKRSPASPPDDSAATTIPDSMKLTAEQKTRLHALLRKTDLSDSEKSELQNLSNIASKEGYDAAAAILVEDQAAARAQQNFTFTAEMQTAMNTAIQTAVNTAVATAIQPLTERITTAENLVKAGIPDAAGGRKGVDGAGGSEEGGGESILDQLKNIDDPTDRAEFYRAHKAEIQTAHFAEKKAEASKLKQKQKVA